MMLGLHSKHARICSVLYKLTEHKLCSLRYAATMRSGRSSAKSLLPSGGPARKLAMSQRQRLAWPIVGTVAGHAVGPATPDETSGIA